MQAAHAITLPGVRRLADFTDGTSNSILCAEKSIPTDRLGSDGGDNERRDRGGARCRAGVAAAENSEDGYAQRQRKQQADENGGGARGAERGAGGENQDADDAQKNG